MDNVTKLARRWTASVLHNENPSQEHIALAYTGAYDDHPEFLPMLEKARHQIECSTYVQKE